MTHKGTKHLETEKLILRRYALNDAYEYACVDIVVLSFPFNNLTGIAKQLSLN
jgi:hypothetical protein